MLTNKIENDRDGRDGQDPVRTTLTDEDHAAFRDAGFRHAGYRDSGTRALPPKLSLFGVGISAPTATRTWSGTMIRAAHERRPMMVSALSVHALMVAAAKPEMRASIEQADLVTSDGQPVRWALNALHKAHLSQRVCGPDLMARLCAVAAQQKLPNFLYGSRPPVLRALCRKLRAAHPSLCIAGSHASRMRTPRFPPIVDDPADEEDVEFIRDSGARLVFVGLGCPLQEMWVAAHRERLGMPALCVGAAFDFLAGLRPRAPRYMQDHGLEWLHRLASDPKRLSGRYFVTTRPSFFATRRRCSRREHAPFTRLAHSRNERERIARRRCCHPFYNQGRRRHHAPARLQGASLRGPRRAGGCRADAVARPRSARTGSSGCRSGRAPASRFRAEPSLQNRAPAHLATRASGAVGLPAGRDRSRRVREGAFALAHPVAREAAWGAGGVLRARRERRTSSYAETVGPMVERVRRAMHSLGDAVVLYTDESARQYRERHAHPKCFVAINTIDARAVDETLAALPEGREGHRARVRETLGLREGALLVGIGGRYIPQHDPRRVFQAVVEARKTGSDVHLIDIGSGPLASVCDAFFSSLPPEMRAAIHRYPRQRFDDTTRLLAACDVFVQPGTIGLTICHAFALGLPFVAHAHEDHAPEQAYLRHGENGLLLPDLPAESRIRAR